MNLYSGGIAVAAGLSAAAYIALARPRVGPARALLLAGVGAMGGLLGARLVYWLGALDFFIGRVHDVRSFFWWTDGGFSLFGAIAGCAGAVSLAGLWLKPAGEAGGARHARDALSLPLLLFTAEGRLLEWTGAGMDFGAIVDGHAWLSVQGEYGRMLNVALLEALLMALSAGVLIARARRTRRVALRDALFLIGLCETLMISMRRDSYMMWGFVHQEQIWFYLLTVGAVLLTAREAGKTLVGFAGALVTAGLVVFLEFALDGRVLVPFAFLRDWADLFWYALFALALIAYVWFYAWLLREAERKSSV